MTSHSGTNIHSMKFNSNSAITKILVFLITILSINVAVAQDIPEKPVPPRLVNDFANILSKKEIRALEKKLVRFNDTTSNQIVVVTVNSLNGYSPAMFASEIGEKWGVGQKGFDNGVVILVKPKRGSSDKGHVSIQAGYGLEPVITDALAKRIIENEILPEFRNNNYFSGIDKATTILMKIASGEISEEGYAKQSGSNGLVALLPFLVIIIVIIIIRSSQARTTGISSRGSGSLWTALWLGSMLGNSGSSSGNWGNFTGGGSGFGGGGGFGGFGGGSFGGGGASGSW